MLLIQDDKPIAAVIPISDYEQFKLWRTKLRRKPVVKKRQALTWREKQERLLSKEIAAFDQMLPDLMKTHRNKWVAILKGKLVDSDDEEQTLTDRVLEKFGDRTMLIRQVTETPRVYHVNSPTLTPR